MVAKFYLQFEQPVPWGHVTYMTPNKWECNGMKQPGDCWHDVSAAIGVMYCPTPSMAFMIHVSLCIMKSSQKIQYVWDMTARQWDDIMQMSL